MRKIITSYLTISILGIMILVFIAFYIKNKNYSSSLEFNSERIIGKGFDRDNHNDAYLILESQKFYPGNINYEILRIGDILYKSNGSLDLKVIRNDSLFHLTLK